MNSTQTQLSPPSLPGVFAVFPGQGSQHVGMARDLFDNFATAREVFEEASDAVRVNLKKLCFEGPESDLVLTENTQPCLLTASVAAFRVAEKELNFFPQAVAGHSLGEYSALVAIGSLDLAVAVSWVRERGIAMQKAVPAGEGTMAAVIGLEDEKVEILCQKATEAAQENRKKGAYTQLSVAAIVEPANFNAPGQVVIAGSTDAVQEAVSMIKRGDFPGGKAIPLSVSAPFHCQLMGPARDRMTEIFLHAQDTQKPKIPRCPYFPNRTARLSREPGTVLELLVEQVNHPVLWKQSMTQLLTLPGSLSDPFQGQTSSGSSPAAQPQRPMVIEFGPGKVLSGLMKRIASQVSQECTLASVGDTASLKNLESILKTLGTA